MNIFLLYISRSPDVPGTIVGAFSTLEKATDEANRLWRLAYDEPPQWIGIGSLKHPGSFVSDYVFAGIAEVAVDDPAHWGETIAEMIREKREGK